jgi:aminoglycoside phosphotransferase (APT) family kinase protein
MTTDLEDRGSFDLVATPRLREFFARHDVLDEPFTARRIGDGHSNLTFLVTGSETGTRLVLRMPPATGTPGAHDVLREARFMAALRDTDVPVPKVFASARAEESPLGVPFFVMSFVPGPVVTTVMPEPLDEPEHRLQAGLSLADTLAALHAVDRQQAGLGDIGRPEGFNARHVDRISRLVRMPDGSLPAAFEPVFTWLTERAPAESDHTIYHGDFRLGNVVLAPNAPGRVAGVLDWELSSVGDPLLDAAYLLISIPSPDEGRLPTQDLGAAWDEPGWPSRAEVAARYEATSGRSLAGLEWYTTMALWKLAALYEFSTRSAHDSYYDDPAQVPAFLAAAARSAGLSETS